MLGSLSISGNPSLGQSADGGQRLSSRVSTTTGVQAGVTIMQDLRGFDRF